MIDGYHRFQASSMRHSRGFTLLEISIVLILVGLIAGGIMVGQDMIEQAKINTVINDVQIFRSAHQTFKEKYKCIPGDCDNSNFTNNLPVCNGGGDGNGKIDGGNSNIYCSETADYWRHLREANLITNQRQPLNTSGAIWAGAQGSYSPTSSVHAKYYTMYGTTANFYAFNLMTDTYDRESFLKVVQAESIDKKVDDGNGTTGNLFGSNPSGSYVRACVSCMPPGGSLDYDFQNNAGCGNYNLTTGSLCSLQVVIDPDDKQ